jgi:hypothetical protein
MCSRAIGDFEHEVKYKVDGVIYPPIFCKADANYAHILALLHSEDPHLKERILYFSSVDNELCMVDLDDPAFVSKYPTSFWDILDKWLIESVITSQ